MEKHEQSRKVQVDRIAKIIRESVNVKKKPIIIEPGTVVADVNKYALREARDLTGVSKLLRALARIRLHKLGVNLDEVDI